MLTILSKIDLSIKDVIQISDYFIEENINLNGKSSFDLDRMPIACKGDYIKFNDFTGLISTIETSKNSTIVKLLIEDINSLFDRKIFLSNQSLISSVGIEDFIAQTIHDNFTDSSDVLLNIEYINVGILTHTILNFSVDNQDGIYNFRTFLGNIKEKYRVELIYSFNGSVLNITILNNILEEMDLDLTVSDVVLYDEVYSIDVIAKVSVLSRISSTVFNYFLRSDRTITTNASDPNRAVGKIDCVVCEADDEAFQKAIDVFKSNSYDHNISFSIVSDSLVYSISMLSVNRLLRIKTLSNGIYSTFISSIKRNKNSKIIECECGNMRVNLIDKLKGVI